MQLVQFWDQGVILMPSCFSTHCYIRQVNLMKMVEQDRVGKWSVISAALAATHQGIRVNVLNLWTCCRSGFCERCRMGNTGNCDDRGSDIVLLLCRMGEKGTVEKASAEENKICKGGAEDQDQSRCVILLRLLACRTGTDVISVSHDISSID